jgi:hypothetical protein
MEIARVKYISGTPTDGNTFNIFSTATKGGNYFAHVFSDTLNLTIKNDQIGKLKEYRSDDAITWTQISETDVAIPGAGASNTYSYDVSQYKHWKLDWVNGGTTQTTWTVDIAISGNIL